jgi:hypothetical protein
MDNNNQPNETSGKPFTLMQKIVVAFLLITALGTLIFGFKHLRDQIAKPFKIKEPEKNIAEEQKNSEILDQQNKDTDKDGLNDYEELNIYQTSPYLADSDSDGIDDKKEIDLGKNPNCPEGENCGSSNISGVIPEGVKEAEPQTNNIFDLNNIPTDLSKIPNLPTDIADISQLPTDLSATEIREIIKQSDVPVEVLDKISDEQLIELYKKTLESMKQQ